MFHADVINAAATVAAGAGGWLAAGTWWRTRLATARRAAYRDRLTGLVNRAGLEAAWQRINGARWPVMQVALADVDGLKPVNDTLGHSAGDVLLTTVAARMAAYAGQPGFAARLGGDEFVIMRPEPSPGEDLAAAGEALHWQICGRPVVIADRPMSLRISVGVTRAWVGTDLYAALSVADAAMYDAKRSGGGVRVARPVVDPWPTGRPAARCRDAAHGRRLATLSAVTATRNPEAS